MKNWFFYKLYVFDKRLFFFIAIFSGLTIFCNLRGDEITPFFVWAMYSQKEDTTNKYDVFRIQVNDSILIDYSSRFTDNNRFFLSAPLSYYKKIQQNNSTDPTQIFLERKLGSGYKTIQPIAEKILNGNYEKMQFTGWYKKYLEQTLGLPVNTFKIDVIGTHFTADQQLQIDSSYLLAEWKQ